MILYGLKIICQEVKPKIWILGVKGTDKNKVKGLSGFTFETSKVSLGNLGLHNASGIYVEKDPRQYPMIWPQDKDGAIYCSPCMPEDMQEDEIEFTRYDTPFERLLDYAQGLQKEHKDLSDAQMLEHPYGHFIGRKRNARWRDELIRRGLAE